MLEKRIGSRWWQHEEEGKLPLLLLLSTESANCCSEMRITFSFWSSDPLLTWTKTSPPLGAAIASPPF